MKAWQVLWISYAAVLIDFFLAQPLKLFALGAQPLWFAVFACVLASLFWFLNDAWLAVLVLVFCTFWLLIVPTANAWNTVLLSVLFASLVYKVLAYGLARFNSKSQP